MEHLPVDDMISQLLLLVLNDHIYVYDETTYNFVFGKLHGKDAVFLIQNIFPTTEKYVIEKYITQNKDVIITKTLENEVIKKSKKVILLAENGKNITFLNIIEMKEKLLSDEFVNT